jgi:hypothetical protein
MGDREFCQEGILTYAGAYGRNERVPVDRLLRREGHHPLGIRRDEATAVATAQAEEAATSNKKWNFGVAAGALLVAGTFAAGALGITGGATPLAGSTPEHAPAAPGHNPTGGPTAGASAPGEDHKQQKPQQGQENAQTKPASAGPQAGAPAGQDTGSQGGSGYGGGSGSGYDGGGYDGGSGSGSSGGSDTQPAPQQPAPPAQQPAPQQPPAQQPPANQQGPLGKVVTPVVDTVDDVLSPVTGLVGGILSPRSAPAPASAGPALTMINPIGDLLGR